MTDFNELKLLLSNRLEEFSYKEETEISIPDVKYIAHMKRPKLLKPKHLFAIIDMPENITGLKTARHFFTFIRNSLLDNYGDALLWKELEISFIVICGDEFFQRSKADGGVVIDVASFSMSSMLGVCYIDKTNLEHFVHSTWGLYFSGDTFKMIVEVTEKWIKEKKSTND